MEEWVGFMGRNSYFFLNRLSPAPAKLFRAVPLPKYYVTWAALHGGFGLFRMQPRYPRGARSPNHRLLGRHFLGVADFLRADRGDEFAALSSFSNMRSRASLRGFQPES